MDACELLAQVTATVDYLRVSTGADRRRPAVVARAVRWSPIPTSLLALVRSTAAGRGTDRDDVAMSLFVQGYAFRIASIAIGGWLLGDAVLDVSPASTAIALGRDRPNAVHLDAAAARRRGPARAPDRRAPRARSSTRPIGPVASARRCCGATSARRARRRSPRSSTRCLIAAPRYATASKRSSRRRVPSSLGRAGWSASAPDGRGSATRAASGTRPSPASSARTARCGLHAERAARYAAMQTEDSVARDPVRFERGHRAARAPFGGRRPPMPTSAPSDGSIPIASTASRRSTVSTSSRSACSAASRRGPTAFAALAARVLGARHPARRRGRRGDAGPGSGRLRRPSRPASRRRRTRISRPAARRTWPTSCASSPTRCC